MFAILFTAYTKSFVSCPIGVQWVGFVMMGYGTSTAVFSVIANSLTRFLPRFTLVLTFIIIDISVISFLLVWDPVHSPSLVITFAVAAVIGCKHGDLPTTA